MDIPEWRNRLISAHKQMQNGMDELVRKQDHQEAERLLRLADTAMLELIAEAGGHVV